MTRRELIAGLGSLAATRTLNAQPKTQMPMLCVYSQLLSKIEYPELGSIAKQLGFEGIDLTIRIGGHVDPRLSNVDLVRALESVRGAGLEVPMITTALTSPYDPTAVPVLALAGRTQVGLFRPGYWKYGAARDIPARLNEVRRDLAGLVAIGQRFGIAAGFHNEAGDNVGAAVWDIQSVIGGMDPRWAGYCFDPCSATAEGGAGGWEIALRLALPRLKMVAVKDFYWAKVNAKWKMQMCPLGEGMVDWSKFFSMLAQSGFSGPISMHMEYSLPDELSAMSKDLAFLRKQVQAAYGGRTTS
jgi:sugar phosphate isomerase/epimerase